MRYSFHGKVRATGQQVDGFVEASSSTEAIDRLADQGIIGVYTVRPEARIPRNTVIFSGQESLEDDEVSAGPVGSNEPATTHAATTQPPLSSATINRAVNNAAANPAVLQQLVDQVKTLSAQVEKLLSRPAQVIYQSGGPVREGGSRRSARTLGAEQSSTLKDIFQNNLDLRRSLEKLASTSGPVAARMPESANRDTNGTREPHREIPKPAPRENPAVRERAMHAQPAA